MMVFLINRMPTDVLSNGNPFQVLFNSSRDYLFLKVFGCVVYPLLCPYNRHKFFFKSKQCVFLGYSPYYLGYRCLDKDTSHIYVAMNVQFDEKIFLFKVLSIATLLSPNRFPNSNLHISPWLQLTYPMPTYSTPLVH